MPKRERRTRYRIVKLDDGRYLREPRPRGGKAGGKGAGAANRKRTAKRRRVRVRKKGT